MCGIVGLFIKDPKLEPRLGSLLAGMLVTMTERGPDSAGFAVYGRGREGEVKLTLRASDDTDLGVVVARIAELIRSKPHIERRGTHVIVSLRAADESLVRRHLAAIAPGIAIVGAGERMELYKEIGLPAEVCARFDLLAMSGTHGIGHTRMATESAVTTNGAHPFSTGPDQCLVHNGSLSNHNALRRRLAHDGMLFQTENDSEVAAGYLTWRLQQGMTLTGALTAALSDLDGFYTFVVGTEAGFAVLRDPIACKPAVVAETGAYVAFGTEYRALVDLPGIEEARVFEPEPATVYVWERNR